MAIEFKFEKGLLNRQQP